MKTFKRILISVMLILSFALPPGFATEIEGKIEPLSPEFLEWQEKQQTYSNEKITRSVSNFDSSASYSGYIPFPVDLSHLVNNPPNENYSNGERITKAGEIPATYDLRNVSGKSYVTSVKSQLPYGTCWAFASIGAMESNALMQGYGTMDLSEMHLAWYVFYNSDSSKAFHTMTSSTAFKTVMNRGGNSFYPTALYSRLSGPVSENEVPYGENKKPSASTPEAYNRVLRLKDVFYIARLNTSFSVNADDTNREIIKRRIMENGSVVANYYNNNSAYNKTANGTAFYSSSKTNEGHAIQIIGWDDNYSRSNFSTNPGIDGAWLIKNSWGNSWNSNNVGDKGCFWMSYKQELTEGAAFIVEEADPNMQVYDYDYLGWTRVSSYSGSSIHFGNVFKATRDESLTEVGFYTTNNNIEYDINVYKGMTSTTGATPISGSSLSSMSGNIPYAGYHTVKLDTPVELSSGEYFSVIVTFKNYNKAPVEMKVSGYASNVKIEDGSYFSSNGTTWQTGKSQNNNACVKAFTTTSATTGNAPKIIGYPPDATLNSPYSATLYASGTKPITWTLSNKSLPDGLTLSSSGEISGTPTKAGNYTFGVTATNAYGSASANFTMNVNELPIITTTNFTGYVGYNFSETLQLSSVSNVTWSASGKLPAGLTLNASTGAITGKPTRAGTYDLTFTANNSAGSSSTSVTFTINPKPIAPKISTSSLPIGMIDESYSGTIRFTGTTPVTLEISGQPNGLTLNPTTGLLEGTPTAAGTFNMTVKISNIVTTLTGGSPVTKNIKLVIKAKPPVIATVPSMPDGIAGQEYTSVQFYTTAGTAPIKWIASGLPKGLTLSASGLLSGTPTKAGTYNMNLKATNSGGSTSARVTIKVFEKPTITTTRLQDTFTDKNYTAKLTAKGTTPITWEISGLPSTLTLTQNATGTTATITGIPTAAETLNLTVKATNFAGTHTQTLTLNVKGVAPKLKATLAKGNTDSNYTGSSISATGTLPINITYSIADSDKTKFKINSLEDLGLTFTCDSAKGTATITGTPELSLKSLPITFSATNIASTTPVTKKATLTITGTKVAFNSSQSMSVTQETDSKVDMYFEVTGTRNITFSMNNISGFTLTQTGDYTAHLSGTAPSKTAKTTITITASNSEGKATKKVILQTTKSKTSTATPMLKTLSTVTKVQGQYANNEAQEISKFGGTNTTLNLENYTIIAKLPVVSVDIGGMYDFSVELDENIETGQELYWLANPKDKAPSDDDTIAEFYDSEGEEITTIPENRLITVSAWLNPGGYYEPAIAIKRN